MRKKKPKPTRRTAPKQEPFPTPKAARVQAGLTWRQLAAVARVSNGTIETCERTGRYPANRHVRAAYLAALGLTEAEVAP